MTPKLSIYGHGSRVHHCVTATAEYIYNDICNEHFVTNLVLSLAVKKLWKSIDRVGVLFLSTHSVHTYTQTELLHLMISTVYTAFSSINHLAFGVVIETEECDLKLQNQTRLKLVELYKPLCWPTICPVSKSTKFPGRGSTYCKYTSNIVNCWKWKSTDTKGVSPNKYPVHLQKRF